MSGYRSLHREKVGDYPIWTASTSPLLTTKPSLGVGPRAPPAWRVWAACGDGFVRGFWIQEKSLDATGSNGDDVLDASACSCTCTHVLGSPDSESSSAAAAIGCSQVALARNYVGDDTVAGDLLVVSMDLAGKVRIWQLPETMDDDALESSTSDAANPTAPQHIAADQEFVVENATGTTLQICPPTVIGVGDVKLAIPRLDGSVAIVATGIQTPKTHAKKTPTPAGSITDVWSKAGSIAMSTCWYPGHNSMVAGRQDGLVEILGERPHRLVHHEAPVRAVAITPDANLLITTSDDGMLAVWDLGRPVPALVHHVVEAHGSWILSLTALSDSRRFLTCGADRKLHVWSAGQMHQSLHSFTCDDMVWTIHAAAPSQRGVGTTQGAIPPRLVSGSENGNLQIYSLEP